MEPLEAPAPRHVLPRRADPAEDQHQVDRGHVEAKAEVPSEEHNAHDGRALGRHPDELEGALH
eukprot:6301452-Alexandrium_andersonii.AAC.1